MPEQLALLDGGRVYENERASWEATEAYYSRPEYVWPLVEYLSQLPVPMGNDYIVEPCVGGGALVDGLSRYLEDVERFMLTGDVRDVSADWCGNWLERPKHWRWNRDVRHLLDQAWLVATNPPFSLARQVVEASWKHCPGALVAILQRASWYEPTEDRGAWLREYNPDQVTIGRCEFFRPDGSSAGKGDSTSYTWYVFMPLSSGGQGPRGGHHEIIPWKEAPHAQLR